MELQVGQQAIFMGYDSMSVPETPILNQYQRVVIAEATSLEAFTVFPVDDCGRVFSWQGETVFDTEILPLALPPVPIKHLPRPYGDDCVDYA